MPTRRLPAGALLPVVALCLGLVASLAGNSLAAVVAAPPAAPAPADATLPLTVGKGTRIVLMGNGLGSRMLHFGHFESGLHLRFPDQELFVRNLCDEGNTPSFRPHSARRHQLGFPGAEAFAGAHSDDNPAAGVGHFETEEQWLQRLRPDVLIAFFGFNASFAGLAGLPDFRAELDAFLTHTRAQAYNGVSLPRVVLVGPTAFEDRSAEFGPPDGRRENERLAAYTAVMRAVAAQHDVPFVDAFAASRDWMATSFMPLTADGALLNDAGYAQLSRFLLDTLFGDDEAEDRGHAELVRAAVAEKNWFWIHDFKMPNGVHAFGRRFNPFGPANYPFEIDKIRELTAIRDEAVWAAASSGEVLDLAPRDAATAALPPVETNYTPGGKNGALRFLTGDEALAALTVPDGYRIEQWATEVEFPDLANPVQMTFDNRGRLWVATMPSYPHYRPGDSRPDDKLLILEDTDGDGRADKQTVWADGLHLPMGFEITADGVYLSQGIHLVLLRDVDGDDRADSREIVLSGFDDHDTHHAISAYCADPSGAIMMCEGTFLRTSVETRFGPVRGTNGGFFRFAPQRRHLERFAQLSIPNPWGVGFDAWGQPIFLHTSGPTVEWMLPGSVRPRYGVATPGSTNLIEPDHRVRPTSGIEFLSSRHFPDAVQGDLLLNNTIGFLGTKQHQMLEEGTGFTTRWRQDLVVSSDGNFRPVDMEIAPDGSLYLVDWHNPLIGHMQHNARDPHRDHDHGRIYRVSYPSRPLVEPPLIAGAPIGRLLENLKLPEDRARYRTRRELRGRDPDRVLHALRGWVAGLDPSEPRHEHHLLEALWVTWGLDRVDVGLLERLLASDDHRARAAAVRVLRYSGHLLPDQAERLERVARDPHGRVRLEAITAASWLGRDAGLAVLAAAEDSARSADAPHDPHVSIDEGGRLITLRHPVLAEGGVNAVRITVPGDDRLINLAELAIHDTAGRDITHRATFSQSSEYNGGQHPIANLTDGDRGNFSHTAHQTDPWVAGRFDGGTAIGEIVIWNRPGFETRLDDARVEFTTGDGPGPTLTIDIDAAFSGLHADPWLRAPFRTARAHLEGRSGAVERVISVPEHLNGAAREQYLVGAEVYEREGHCGTCHQPDGLGLAASGFPPLAGTDWVLGDEQRLVKLTLNGLLGPMRVDGRDYPGLVPMTPFGGLLDDDELAAVLTFVRNSFGNRAAPISAASVAEVRRATQARAGFYSPAELLGAEHADSASARSFVAMWTTDDFADALAGPLHGRSFRRGEQLFAVASCTACHNVQGRGADVGADLSGVGERYEPAELLRHVLEPSSVIAESHQLYRITLEDGTLHSGLIVAEDAETLTLVEAIQRPDETLVLRQDAIATRHPSALSAMPEGLLATLQHDEVLDLLAYVYAHGRPDHPVFGED